MDALNYVKSIAKISCDELQTQAQEKLDRAPSIEEQLKGLEKWVLEHYRHVDDEVGRIPEQRILNDI